MLALITESIGYMFPGSRALNLIKKGLRIINSSNLLILTKNIILTVIDCCTPLPIRLAVY